MAKFISLNVKGLNSNIKRRLLTEIKTARADIVFLQKTHFKREGNFSFAKKYYPTAYLASTDRKKAGVAILISETCPIQITNSYLDNNGRFIILQGILRGLLITLCNLYAPNISQVKFFK